MKLKHEPIVQVGVMMLKLETIVQVGVMILKLDIRTHSSGGCDDAKA